MSYVQMLSNTYFGNTILQYLIFLGIVAGGILAGKVMYYLFKNIFLAFAQKTETKIDDIIVNSAHGPLVFLVFVIAFNIGYRTLTLNEATMIIFGRIVSIFVIINIAWLLIKFLDEVIVHYLHPLTEKTKSDLDDHLVPLLRKLVKIILVIIAGLMILDDFGYDVTSILAGLGIGGLAFALAAKDLLANIFGGITILTDQPFKLGQRIRIEDKDGIIEEIGLRSTKMRTLDKTQLVIPNAKFTDSIIENVTRETSRKVSFSLGVQYDTTAKKLEKGIEIIKKIIEEHPKTADKFWVYFDEFADSSLNIQVIYYIKSKDWEVISQSKSEINFEIKKKFDQFRISIAFPSRTVYMKK